MILGPALGKNHHLWGVLDGHGGCESVSRLVKWLPEALEARLKADGGDHLSPEAIIETIEKVDERLLADAKEHGFEDGATSLLVVASGLDSTMQLVQIGDSQVVRCGAFGTEELCPQHRTDNASEAQRLASIDVEIVDDRVKGRRLSLAVTRSLGDYDLKDAHDGKGVTATAEVREEVVSASDDLLILGCDGLWDVMGPDDAWELVKRKGRKERGVWDLDKVAFELVQAAYDLKSGDNISVLVLSLRRPRRGRPSGAPAKPKDMDVTINANGQIQAVQMKSK